jgi:hypothetical protein
VPDIDWAAGTARGRAKELLEAADDRLLEQLVAFPTHVHGNVLDLIFTDTPEQLSDITEEGRLGSSDHVVLTWTVVIKASPPPAQARALPNWRKVDWDSMRRELARANWNELLAGLTADQAWHCLKGRIHGLVEKYVPARRRRNHNRPPWLTRDILRAIRRKKWLWKQAKVGQNIEDYKAAEKTVKNMIRNLKRRFEREIAKGSGSEQANKRRFFSYVRKENQD